EEVEPGFADADHLGMLRQFRQPLGVDCRLAASLMRMDTNRAIDVRVALGDLAYPVELGDLGRDRDHATDAGRPRAGHHLVELGVELGEVQMAVAVHQHQDALFPFSLAPAALGLAGPEPASSSAT